MLAGLRGISNGDSGKHPSGMIRAANIKGPVPDQEWLLQEWFPARAVSLLSGQGGVGKTLLIHQLANCVATGKDFLEIPTQKMPVVAVLCEDDRPAIRRRQLSINTWIGRDDVGGSAPNSRSSSVIRGRP